jgi:O-antigen ligase
MKERCPQCRLPLQRGEEQDYWLGGMMFNIVLSELLAVLAVAIVVLVSWPRVPWNAVWAGAVLLMIAAPFLLFPLSRMIWLAFDLLFRPQHESHYR